MQVEVVVPLTSAEEFDYAGGMNGEITRGRTLVRFACQAYLMAALAVLLLFASDGLPLG